MGHYLDQALAIDYADVQVESLPEAMQAHQPLGPANTEREFIDLTLEDCISMALQNAKILPASNGANSQTGPVSALMLSAQPGQLPSVYDAALVSTIASTQPLQIDSQGNRVPFVVPSAAIKWWRRRCAQRFRCSVLQPVWLQHTPTARVTSVLVTSSTLKFFKRD